jgi:hypothetical protein
MTTATDVQAGTGTPPERAKAVADEAAGKASEVASSAAAAADAKALAGDAKGEVLTVAGEAKDKVRDLAADARQQLRQQAEEQAGRAAGAMRELSGQLTSMAGAADGGLVPDLARQASSSIDGLARRLDDGGLDALVADVKRYARNNPGTFLLGAAAAGLLAGRLTRSVDTHALLDAAKPGGGDQGQPGNPTEAPPLDLTTAAATPVTDPLATQPLPAEPVAERPLRAPGH